jgi:hypothetical protein
MLGAYAEYGAIGVIILLFAGQLVWMQRMLTKKLDDIQGICIKLIDRWNRSDETRDRRHEQIIQEMNDVTDEINFIKGRINGGSR